MASTRIARMICIWVILSVWICCVRCSQRRLIPMDGDEHDSNLDLNINPDLDRCDNDDEQCQSMATAADRSLLGEVGLLLYVRAPQWKRPVPIVLDPFATVGDLRAAAARDLRVEPNEVELSYGGEVMRRDRDGVTLADMGFSQESEVQAHINIPNEIDDLERFLDVKFPPEIHEMKHTALRGVTDEESVDFSDVIKAINDIGDEKLVLNIGADEKLPRIFKVQIADPTLERLQWQHLPQQAQNVFVGGIAATEMSLQGIECAHLEMLSFWSLPNLTHLNLNGIQKCTSLEQVTIVHNQALKHLDLTPLSGSAALTKVYLFDNALEDDLDLSPLSECPALSLVHLQGNQFSAVRQAEMKDALARVPHVTF